jgi:hypothetical protein
MCLASLDCDFHEEIISTMASLLNIDTETLSPIIEQNSKLIKIKKKIEKYVDAWTDRIEQAYIDAYDQLADSMIFTENKSVCPLCNIEKEWLSLLLKVLPEADQSIFKAIQKDQWEVISEENRNLLISYIETLSKTPDILNRYIGAPDQFKYTTQVEETIMKLKNPPYYRVRKKMLQIADIVDGNEIPTTALLNLETDLDKILADLILFDFSYADKNYNKETVTKEITEAIETHTTK